MSVTILLVIEIILLVINTILPVIEIIFTICDIVATISDIIKTKSDIAKILFNYKSANSILAIYFFVKFSLPLEKNSIPLHL